MKALLAGLLLLISVPATAQTSPQTPTDIRGTWLSTDEDGNRDSVVEIVREGEQYVGSVRWIRYSVYPAGDRMAGQAIVDRENPDPAQRQNPVLGMKVLWGFREEDGQWTGGQTYSVRSGKQYKAIISLQDENTLKLRGYLGTPLLGQTVLWTRSAVPPREAKPTQR